jgi:hypothetical protein
MTAAQFAMFTLPIPPANPSMWNEAFLAPPPPPPLQVPPQILSDSADPSTGGGACDFAVTEDVPCNAVLEWGTDGITYPNVVSTMGSGNGTTRQTVTVTGFTGGTTYHYRFTVTGISAPNDVSTTSADKTFVGVA